MPKLSWQEPIQRIIYDIEDDDRVDGWGRIFRKQEKTDQGYILRDVQTGSLEPFSFERISRLIDDGDFEVDRGYYSKGAVELRLALGGLELKDFSKLTQDKVKYDAAMLDVYGAEFAVDGEIKMSDEKLPAVLKKISDEVQDPRSRAYYGKARFKFDPPSARTFREKWKKYHACGCNELSLIDKRSLNSRRSPLMKNLASYHLALEFAAKLGDTRRPGYKPMHKLLRQEVKKKNAESGGQGGWVHPCLTTFTKMVKRQKKFVLLTMRHDESVARNTHTITNRGFLVQRIGERIEVDETPTDAVEILQLSHLWDGMTPEEQESVPRVRLWLTTAVDAVSMYCPAMKFSLVRNSDTVLAVLRMMIEDKTEIARAAGAATPWFPVVAYTCGTDHGSALKSVGPLAALRGLGIKRANPQTGDPSRRPFGETLFHTIVKQSYDFLPGRTFSDYITRGNYNPAANAALFVDELNRYFVRDIIDRYHNTPRDRRSQDTPHNTYVRLSQESGLRPPIPKHRIRHIFGQEFTRKLTKGGVSFLGIRYQSDFLQEHFFNKEEVDVRIRVDEYDLEVSSICLPNGVWVSVENIINLPPRVTLWEWTTAGEALIERNGTAAEQDAPIMLAAVEAGRAMGDIGMSRIHAEPIEVLRQRAEALERRMFHVAGMSLSPLPTGTRVKEPSTSGKALVALIPGMKGPAKEMVPLPKPQFISDEDDQFGSGSVH